MKQTSSMAGTMFHATKLPLTVRFAAIPLIVTAKNRASPVSRRHPASASSNRRRGP